MTMADLFEKASSWLEGMRERHASRVVEYSRDGAMVAVPATIGRTVFEIAREYGPLEKTESRDFLILSKALLLNGNHILPIRGDRITEHIGDQLLVYEVMAPGNEPEWRWSDPYRRTLRIHTKLIATEDA